MESESLAFHAKVIEGFEQIAAGEPERVLRVDAHGSVDEVAARVWDAVSGHPALASIPRRS
jgi:dTMP kinase